MNLTWQLSQETQPPLCNLARVELKVMLWPKSHLLRQGGFNLNDLVSFTSSNMTLSQVMQLGKGSMWCWPQPTASRQVWCNSPGQVKVRLTDRLEPHDATTSAQPEKASVWFKKGLYIFSNNQDLVRRLEHCMPQAYLCSCRSSLPLADTSHVEDKCSACAVGVILTTNVQWGVNETMQLLCCAIYQ